MTRVLWFAVLIAILPTERPGEAPADGSECVEACLADEDHPPASEAECEKWCNDRDFDTKEI